MNNIATEKNIYSIISVFGWNTMPKIFLENEFYENILRDNERRRERWGEKKNSDNEMSTKLSLDFGNESKRYHITEKKIFSRNYETKMLLKSNSTQKHQLRKEKLK